MDYLHLREPVSAWSHGAGLLLALPGTLLLWRRSAGDTTKRLSLLVYGLSLAFCYTASTLYHGVRLPAAWRPIGSSSGSSCRSTRGLERSPTGRPGRKEPAS